MYVIALDPGGTTGWASFYDNPHETDMKVKRDLPIWDRGQIGPYEHHGELLDFLMSEKPDTICFEEFTYQIRNKSKYAAAAVNLISKEYIGIIKYFGQRANIELVARHASHAKSTWTDDKLKALGLWVPGNPHAMDATRHLLAHLVVDLKMTNLLAPLRPRD